MMVILVISVTLLSVLIAGCTSEGLSGIYLLSLSYTGDPGSTSGGESDVAAALRTLAANHTAFEIRAGYMGMCLLISGQTICSRSASSLQAFVRQSASEGESGDPLELIRAAKKFQEETVFVPLL